MDKITIDVPIKFTVTKPDGTKEKINEVWKIAPEKDGTFSLKGSKSFYGFSTIENAKEFVQFLDEDKYTFSQYVFRNYQHK
ncbi:MAG: hypothetical protein Q4G63_10035 [Bacteroidia bacterium]|nr:hypothetical protein [Bacteroidia bacterium]